MRLTIGKKLGLSFAIVIGLMVVSSAVVYLSIARMNASIVKLTDQAFPIHEACGDAQTALSESVAAQLGYVILGDISNLPFKQERRSAWNDIEKTMAKLEALFRDTADADERKHFDVLQKQLPLLKDVQLQVEEAAHAKEQEKKDLARDLMERKSAPIAAQMNVALDSLSQSAGKRVADERKNLDAASTSVTRALWLASLLAIVMGSAIAIFLSRKIPLDYKLMVSEKEQILAQRLKESQSRIEKLEELLEAGGVPLGQLGVYQLLEKLGQGGMGVVYKARHTLLHRLVALKVLSADRMQDVKAVARFRRKRGPSANSTTPT